MVWEFAWNNNLVSDPDNCLLDLNDGKECNCLLLLSYISRSVFLPSNLLFLIDAYTLNAWFIAAIISSVHRISCPFLVQYISTVLLTKANWTNVQCIHN